MKTQDIELHRGTRELQNSDVSIVRERRSQSYAKALARELVHWCLILHEVLYTSSSLDSCFASDTE